MPVESKYYLIREVYDQLEIIDGSYDFSAVVKVGEEFLKTDKRFPLIIAQGLATMKFKEALPDATTNDKPTVEAVQP